jgi:tRNA threonylcarbamoyladenosine biosynthesis protein TsaE
MEIRIKDLDHISEAAQHFIEQIGDSRVLAFYGGMGAGKSTFIKAICEQLGVEDVITSPTFAIVNEYTSHSPLLMPHSSIYHFDFYRIKKLEEVYDMGYEDYFYSGGLCLIEWPELIEEILPDSAKKITIEQLPNGERIVTL